ncbi:MAG: hypothetical protein M0036_17495 [Desulfobacteraceae bacterium]|nr:hypothetical protein [Desulfobacteraceae bacterium]
MKRIMAQSLAMLAVILLVVTAASAAEVSQGKCLQYDKTAMKITIEEYDIQFSKEAPYGRPTGVQSVFDVAKAQIGITPQPGDILRLAYDQNGADKIAIKVMNVSKQDLKKK